MVHHAISDLIASGPGSIFLKLDLESAFCHIPVRRADWHLLGFNWQDELYYDVVLAFGLRSAPYIFNLFAEALHWIMARYLPAKIRHYLDDFWLTFSPTSANLPQKARDWCLALGSALGLTFLLPKVLGPTTCADFLGIELDSVAMHARLTNVKLEILRDTLRDWSLMSHCTLRDLQELTGYLMFCSQVIPFSRAFIRSMHDFSSSFSSGFSRRRLPDLVRRDI
jgi:hypothetical protein